MSRILRNGAVSVKINDEISPYIQSAKGVHQGDLFSPFLFNLAAECLTNMVLAAQKNNLFQGLVSDLIDGGVGILQYADDTVLCFSHDVEKAKMLNCSSICLNLCRD